jgi:hypothetical protein
MRRKNVCCSSSSSSSVTLLWQFVPQSMRGIRQCVTFCCQACPGQYWLSTFPA